MITLSRTPVLNTPRLTLRAPVAADWPHFRDFALSERSHFVRAPDIDETLAWRGFAHVIGMWVLRGYGSFIFCRHGEDRALGMTGPWHPVNWPEPEIGWTVWDAAAEGQGLAFEAAEAGRTHVFRDLGWPTVVSYIDPANTRSIRLAERLGARPDPAAPHPRPDEPCLVYRHPAPQGIA
ncbi:MAG: GNAT family N-acetyltransferase [Paracoccaceae bacterium]|nr:MAG: GNAT family N-acetyltransferase [Paracoccaceae bacterium]